MKILIIGSTGLLGTDLLQLLQPRYEVYNLNHQQLDISSEKSIADCFLSLPDGINWCINCAAYTLVDQAEINREQSYRLNAVAPKYLAKACRKSEIRLLHLSTDYVFDGESESPYHENDATNPLNYYGQTKLEGEKAVLDINTQNIIARTTWLFGAKRSCFPEVIINAWRAGKPLRIVNDEISCPTYTKDLSEILKQIMKKNVPGGIYHTVGSQALSRYDYALKALQAYQKLTQTFEKEIAIEPISFQDWTSQAKRPQYSVLSTKKLKELGLEVASDIEKALEDYCHCLLNRSTVDPVSRII